MRFFIGAVLSLSILSACATSHTGRVSDRPNIVFVLADDMGYGDPTCNNRESKIPTPNIDRIAAQGMRFTDAHAPGSYCIPSRYGLLTGRYPMRAKFRVRREAAIAADQLTVASLLRERGYRTAMVGKWHLGFDGGPNFDWTKPMRGGPVDVGFEQYFGIPASLDIPPYYYIRDRRAVAPPTERIGAKSTAGWTKIQGEFWRAGGIAEGFVHEEVLPRFEAEAVRYIDERGRANDAAPFFLYVALTAPHTPWLPTASFRGKSAVDLYGDFTMQVDATVGAIVAALERNGFAEDTLVIFSSDNGPVWYPQDVERFGHRSVGPLRGMKSDAWEGGHRMPFIARWPGVAKPGSVCAQTLCFTDMLATFAAISGESLTDAQSSAVDSVSILPLLRGEAAPVRDVTVLSNHGTVIRQGKWKLITHLGSGGFSKPRRVDPTPGGPQGQLYDLSSDLAETTNLWAQRPDIVARLTQLLQQAKR